MRIVLFIFTWLSLGIQADEAPSSIKDVSDKVIKKKGYCSPLDKLMGGKNCKKSDSAKLEGEIPPKLKEIGKKIGKRNGYCSPLEKAAGTKNCKKED